MWRASRRIADFARSQAIGVASPHSARISRAYLEIGAKGSSFTSLPATMGMRSSSRPVSSRRMRLFAWPRRPSRMKWCRASSAFTIWGRIVSSYPTIPGNSGSPDSRRLSRLFRISSRTVRPRSGGSAQRLFFNSPRVRGSIIGPLEETGSRVSNLKFDSHELSRVYWKNSWVVAPADEVLQCSSP